MPAFRGGAQTHHYATKIELVTAAVEFLGRLRWSYFEKRSEDLPEGPDRIGAALDMLWASAGEPFNDAVIELWIASRTDPELRSAVVETERRLQEQFWDLLRTLMGAEAASHPNFNLRIEFALAQI